MHQEEIDKLRFLAQTLVEKSTVFNHMLVVDKVSVPLCDVDKYDDWYKAYKNLQEYLNKLGDC